MIVREPRGDPRQVRRRTGPAVADHGAQIKAGQRFPSMFGPEKGCSGRDCRYRWPAMACDSATARCFPSPRPSWIPDDYGPLKSPFPKRRPAVPAGLHPRRSPFVPRALHPRNTLTVARVVPWLNDHTWCCLTASGSPIAERSWPVREIPHERRFFFAQGRLRRRPEAHLIGLWHGILPVRGGPGVPCGGGYRDWFAMPCVAEGPNPGACQTP